MSSDIAKYADDTTPYDCAPYYDKSTAILHLRNLLIESVENLVKNFMHCPEYHKIYHQRRSVTFQFNSHNRS